MNYLEDEFNHTPTLDKQIDPTQANKDWKLSAETNPFVWDPKRESKVVRMGGASWTLIEPSWCADAQGGSYFTTMQVTRQLERDLAKEKTIAHVNARMNQGLIPSGVKFILITYFPIPVSDKREGIMGII